MFEKCHGNALVDDSDYCPVFLTHLHHGFDVRVLCVAHACSADTVTQHSCLREFNAHNEYLADKSRKEQEREQGTKRRKKDAIMVSVCGD